MRLHLIGKFLLLLLVLGSCNQDPKKKTQTDTPTGGSISIAVDEAFMPLIQSEINAFQGNYPKARIHAWYVSEKRAFEMLLKDSVRLVISGRGFNEEEKAYFKSQTISPKSMKIATDALGVVLHKSNPDSLLSTDALRKILTQSNFKWKDLSGKGIAEEPTLIIDKEGTSNYLSLLHRLGLEPSQIKLPIMAAGGDREVINHVHQHPNAIGFMGVSWISDPDDPTQTRFLQSVRIAHLMPDSIANLLKKHPLQVSEEYYQPLQAYMAQGFYPLTRDVMVASREARAGLGTGFMAWLASDKGQRVVLKAGLLPATMPLRIVKIRKQNDITK